MGTRADSTTLRELDDPEFFAQWSLTRQQLAVTPKSNPEHSDIKRHYDALSEEYRRRINGEP